MLKSLELMANSFGTRSVDHWALQFRERIKKGVEALGQTITQGGCALSLGDTKALPARRKKAKLTIRPTAFGKESTPSTTDRLTMTSKSSAPAQLDPIPWMKKAGLCAGFPERNPPCPDKLILPHDADSDSLSAIATAAEKNHILGSLRKLRNFASEDLCPLGK